MAEKRVVWVLGAGFSAPLGGPMLGYLLSPEAFRDRQVAYPQSKLLGTAESTAVHLYAWGRNFAEGFVFPNDKVKYEGRGEVLWRDAEQYLDILDTARAAPDSHMAKRILQIAGRIGAGNVSVQALAEGARRVIAAECSMFLRHANTKLERWEPFRDWASGLSGRDIIITFNYDRVLEMLGAFDVIVPTRKTPVTFERYDRKKPVVLKLHGSVDWCRTAEGSFKQADPEHFVTCDAGDLAIGVPGPSKQEFANEVRQLWDFAEDALNAAHAVVFIGYRFPETDAAARKRLLSAIRENELAQQLDLHTVLGPREDEHTIRLLALLRTTCTEREWVENPRVPGEVPRTYHIKREPLWCEDYLTVWDRERLFSEA